MRHTCKALYFNRFHFTGHKLHALEIAIDDKLILLLTKDCDQHAAGEEIESDFIGMSNDCRAFFYKFLSSQ